MPMGLRGYGHQVLSAIRELEEAVGITDLAGVKVIMTTAMRDPQHVLDAFREGCESYIVKPVEKSKLFEEMDKLGLFAKTDILKSVFGKK